MRVIGLESVYNMTLTGDANIDVAMSGEISPAVYPNAVDVHHGGGVEDFDNHISAEFLGVFGTPDEKPGGIGSVWDFSSLQIRLLWT